MHLNNTPPLQQKKRTPRLLRSHPNEKQGAPAFKSKPGGVPANQRIFSSLVAPPSRRLSWPTFGRLDIGTFFFALQMQRVANNGSEGGVGEWGSIGTPFPQSKYHKFKKKEYYNNQLINHKLLITIIIIFQSLNWALLGGSPNQPCLYCLLFNFAQKWTQCFVCTVAFSPNPFFFHGIPGIIYSK